MRNLTSKLIAVLAILCFMVSPVWADPSMDNAHIGQTGPLNDAEIDQTDADNMNFAVIHQNSDATGGQDGNDAKIDQSGVDNNYYYYGSTADIDQDGHGNDAAIVQGHNADGTQSGGHDNHADIYQVGVQNQAKVDQAGTYNTGTVDQNGRFNQGQVQQPGDENTGSVYQGGYDGYGVSTNNQAIVYQPGDGNYGTIYQYDGVTNGLNKAEVNQSGNGNNGSIMQMGSENEAKVHQHPDPEFVGHEQSGDEPPTGNDNTAYIDQYGQRNKAFVDQDGDNNTADIDQDGEDNRASIKQIQFTPELDGSRLVNVKNNFAKIDQNGARNQANILQTQNGENNNAPPFDPATIVQDGDDNKASITQRDSNSQVASITQEGNRNLALISQRDGDSTLFNQNAPHQATVYQDGDDNQAVVLQKGELDIEAAGPMHIADISQVGSLNQAWIVQGTSTVNGPSYTASIHQNGTANRALIRQGDMPEDPHNFSIVEPMDPSFMADFMDIPAPGFPWPLDGSMDQM
jgi:curlin associated repeat protein